MTTPASGPVTTLPNFDWPYRLMERQVRWIQAIARGREGPKGVTPREAIWRKNKATLWRVKRDTPPTYKTPILIVFPLINRWYILDLQKGNSFVEFLSQQGFDVFLLDWGTPGDEDRRLRIDDYVQDYIPRMVKRTLRASGASDLTLIGHCIGGTLTACYVGSNPDAPVRNVVLLTAPIDFTEAGYFGLWTKRDNYDVDRLVETFGNVPGWFVDVGSKLLKPWDTTAGVYTGLWNRLDRPGAEESWQAMYTWVNDGVPFAGEAFRQWIKEFYQENKLSRGELVLGGKPVRLGSIKQPFLIVVANRDNIAPLTATDPVMELIGSHDKTRIELKGGHIGVVAGSSAKRTLWPQVTAWLANHSEPNAEGSVR